MANFNEIKDYAEKRAFYESITRFFGTGNSTNKLFYTALFAVVAIFLVIRFFNWTFNSDYIITWNKVKSNDSLFADEKYIGDTSITTLRINKLLRPINSSDIDKMKLEEWEKEKMKDNIDSTLDPRITYGTIISFEQDSMYKYKSGFIGTFIKRDSVQEYAGFARHWYAFKPVKNGWNYNWDVDLPKGYTYADSNYYVSAEDVRLNEIKKFKVTKDKR